MAAQAAAAACPLLQLSDDVLEVVGHQISDALRPAVAGALAACNHNLWRVMRAPLAKLQPRHAAARALAAKVGSSCSALSELTALKLHKKGLNAADMATLAMLFSTGALARVEHLWLSNDRLGPAGASALFDGLCWGSAPRLRNLYLHANELGGVGAAALAAALSRGALPNLEVLLNAENQIGDEGLVALAAPLRRRPAFKALNFDLNGIGDAGVAALVDKLGAKEFKQLKFLDLAGNRLGDDGCATLTAALDGATLPALRLLNNTVHMNSLASAAARRAVHDAVRANEARAAACTVIHFA